MTRMRAVCAAVMTLTLLSLPSMANAGGPPLVTPKGTMVSEGVRRAYVVVTLKAKAPRNLSIPFATVSGTAKAGRDFRAITGKVGIKKGAKSAKIAVVIINDPLVEPTENFKVKLTDGASYNLSTKSVTVTIKDDDAGGGTPGGTASDAIAKVHQWAGDLTVHVTETRPGNPSTIDDDWTFVAHLVLAPQPYTNQWFPTSASGWTLNGRSVTNDPSNECNATPDHTDWATSGVFMANPTSGYPSVGQAQYSLNTQVGTTPSLIEADVINAAAVQHTFWDYMHHCTEHVGGTSSAVSFQTHWRSMDPVGHPGTFPLTLHFGASAPTTLTADFTDIYTDPNHAGWVTHSRVTGTLTGS